MDAAGLQDYVLTRPRRACGNVADAGPTCARTEGTVAAERISGVYLAGNRFPKHGPTSYETGIISYEERRR